MKFFDCFDTLESEEITLRLTEKFEGNSDGCLPFYYYDIFENFAGDFAGKISIRIGDNPPHSYFNGHIGYEIEENKRGHGYAEKACRLVLPIALAHGMSRIYITCEESNAASKRTAEKLGAKLIETVPVSKAVFFFYDGIEDYCIYELKIREDGENG